MNEIMKSEHQIKNKALNHWERLLCSCFYDPSMSEEMRVEILLLLSDGIFEPEKLAILEKYFNHIMVNDDTDPHENILVHWQKIKAKLGFPEP